MQPEDTQAGPSQLSSTGPYSQPLSRSPTPTPGTSNGKPDHGAGGGGGGDDDGTATDIPPDTSGHDKGSK